MNWKPLSGWPPGPRELTAAAAAATPSTGEPAAAAAGRRTAWPSPPAHAATRATPRQAGGTRTQRGPLPWSRASCRPWTRQRRGPQLAPPFSQPAAASVPPPAPPAAPFPGKPRACCAPGGQGLTLRGLAVEVRPFVRTGAALEPVARHSVAATSLTVGPRMGSNATATTSYTIAGQQQEAQPAGAKAGDAEGLIINGGEEEPVWLSQADVEAVEAAAAGWVPPPMPRPVWGTAPCNDWVSPKPSSMLRRSPCDAGDPQSSGSAPGSCAGLRPATSSQ